ncbi:hypothetical protein GCM10009096_31930 [Parasphingorhabdus litoris]|uniref:Uncharacterized protein n=1 Tax=Parasphingorhabdus litoris TaxID=394733 RepID=A0ABN1AYV1_9SPHN|nr:hypothetical protein [Parasphingorhabdus litoris]
MELTEQNMDAKRAPIMAVAAGVGAALVVVTLPHVYLESTIGATGLSEILPAAAPPLGNTARGLLAIMAGLVSASAIYFFLNRKGSSDMGVALREQINAASPIELELEEEAKKKKRFALPKFDAKSLTKFLKRPKKDKAKVMDLADLPQLRKLDDDAEEAERPSIFNVPDAADPIAQEIQQFEEPAALDIPEESVAETTSAEAEVAVENAAPVEAPVVETAVVDAETVPEPVQKNAMPKEDLSALSIAQLADRLEAGLTRLKQLEAASLNGAAVASPAPATEPSEPAPQHENAPAADPVRDEAPAFTPPPLKEVEQAPEPMMEERQADMDVALKAALGTLEKMTAQR